MISETEIKTMSKGALEHRLEANKRTMNLLVGTLYPDLIRAENAQIREELMRRK